MKKSFRIKLRLVALISVILFTSCGDIYEHNNTKPNKTSEYSDEVITEWMDLMLTLTKETSGFSPPVAARAFAYTGLGVYESVHYGMPGYKSMAGQINEYTEQYLVDIDSSQPYHWGLVANTVIAEIIKECYKPASEANKSAINSLRDQFEEKFRDEISSEIFDESKNLGMAVAANILEYTNSDGQAMCYHNNFPEDYSPPSGEGLWVPTAPGYLNGMQPYWGDVRPFMAENVTEVQPQVPPAYSTEEGSAFFKETVEVYEAVNNLSREELTIAHFWSDDPGLTATPPGHSVSILRQVLEKEKTDLGIAAVAFAKLGMGLHDAFISCWKSKYNYNLIRPITVIHEHIDPDFEIPLITPPFPEYTSGHSVQSGAAAQILTDLFGPNYSFTDHTHEGRTDINGEPRSFNSFFEFAEEAAISRLYGGIHYRSAIELGVTQGKEIGENIGTLKFR